MKGCPLRFGLLEGSVLFCLWVADPTAAQIVPDATLPNNTTVNLQGTRSVIEGGTTTGSNLFHSFREFSVPTGGEAFFNNTSNIQNIFSRVTGGSISNIDGLIRANGTANLFLLNPNGIVFGSNARLNIGGSFLASTANSLRFSDGREFSATNPQAPPLLTVNVPIGLQFGPNPGRLVNQARLFDIGLQVKPGETLALVGGEVNLNGGILKAPGGRIELGGVAESAIVGLNLEGNNLRLSFPEGVQRADISLTNQARVDVTANVSGNIALNANNIKLEQSSINSGEPFVVDRAGNITLNATGDIFLTTANLRALGGGGEIDIRAGAIFSTGSVLTVSDFGGVGGNLSIEADRSVSLADTLLISVAGFGEASGSINIRARSISLSDGSIVNVNATGGVGGGISFDASDSVSLSESQVLADGGYPESPGTGGVINITTGSLSLTNGARLTASSQGRGNAGRIIINARNTVLFDGVRAISGRPSGVFSIVGTSAVGDGGGIDITAASLTVTNRAELS
ncbi:MAG TPA: filamentous hemagglutinin, partial [Cyanobacteria bacterium UBA11369]|nr:filamentous hemagglutinin [Cyanobacteria bacterium UBA11369]